MRITTRLKIISSVTIAALILLMPVLIRSFTEFNSAKNDYVLANAILDNFFERASFRDQYFLYREDRERVLWDKNKEISDNLLRQAEAQFHGEEDQQLLERLRRNIEDTAVIFHRIANNIKVLNAAADNRYIYDELDKRLSSQLLLKAAKVRDTATALKDASAQRVELTYQHLTFTIGLFAFILALATILTSMQISRLIRKRLAPIHDGAKIVTGGDLSYRIASSGSDEFAELALSINAMTDKLQAFTKQLEVDLIELRCSDVALQASEERWKFALEGAGDGAWDWNPQTDEAMFSKRWKEMIGYAEREFPNTGTAWIEHLHPDDKDRVLTTVQEYFAGHQPLYVVEFRLRCKDGSWKWILARGKLISRDVDGNPLRMIGTHSDITERKKKEWQLLQLSLALNRVKEAAYLMDEEGKFLYVNDEVCRALDYTREELLGGMGVTDIGPGWTKEKWDEHWLDIKTHGSRTLEASHHAKNGRVFPIEVNANYFEYDGRGYNMALARDITEHKQVEESLHITASVFDNTQEAILITDANNLIIDVNPAFTHITGYTREEVLGHNPKLLNSGHQDKAFYAKMWKSIHQNKTWRGEIWNRRKSGGIYAEMLSISVICDDSGKTLRHVAVFSDISHLKEHEAELSRVAHYDALTNIPNRVLLADRMKQAIAQTSREQNMLAVCYLDLDGFKPINDTMGHDAGDHVLIEVARRIEHTIRGGDTVARLGGDEFVVLLLGLEKGEECVATLERLLVAISQLIAIKNKTCTVSASIGVSIYPLDDEDPDTLLRHADQAMYVAKQSGKNRFHIYDPALDRRARNQHDFLKSIRHALEHDQFELYYQPKVNLRTKELVGAEALIRWRHPERGLLSPAEFLRHVENTDLDVEIGEWVTATALAQMDRWRSLGLDIEISINISGYHLESPLFTERLQQQLAHYPGMPFGKLQIEVLETVALNDIAIVRGIIEACRDFGVGFALDDFGTGYSSLSYLSSLPVNVLKIDQSFVRDMLEDKGDMAIVQGIIALARAFDRQTVAEGIETEDHYRVLLDMGCELGQGYGIARPMPADKLTNWRNE